MTEHIHSQKSRCLRAQRGLERKQQVVEDRPFAWSFAAEPFARRDVFSQGSGPRIDKKDGQRSSYSEEEDESTGGGKYGEHVPAVPKTVAQG